MRRRALAWFILLPTLSLALALSSTGCATSGETLSGEPEQPAEIEQPVTGDDAWAEHTMTDLEGRLQQAARVEIDFEIESQGAVASEFQGTLRWTRAGEISLEAQGSFMGQAQNLAWKGDAQTFATIVAGEQHSSGPRPKALIEAVVISFTRQGLLHNLAVLVGGLPPTLADGGIGEWLKVDQVRLGPPERFGETSASPLEFGIEVEGQHVGLATLWLREGNMPLERQQTVQFPEGQMKVVERYTRFEITD